MHMKYKSIEELETIPCEICGELNMDHEACIVAMKDNEAVCVNCCGCCI